MGKPPRFYGAPDERDVSSRAPDPAAPDRNKTLAEITTANQTNRSGTRAEVSGIIVPVCCHHCGKITHASELNHFSQIHEHPFG